ncbi:phage tail protein I [Pseudomonas anguilliseptica]|uniref:Phage tail protein, P2 protein I family n=1 Tax=Pseudomonas anguilliseptica TaxID=53406 RepID=A0A1H5GWZ4_PSEAG|nr:phage tail protein I [Pseudomonas anguilliseptica]SEE19558.1 phage tail protein, P2 protein I family [Pseudomonas anguilliseptica]
MADQLPPALAGDERFAVLCELLQEEFDNLDLSPMLVYLVDVVPPQVLPHLADQFHVMGLEGWRYARDDQEQRELIKRAIELHRYKGTPWAIEQVLVTLNLIGRVSEWYEYGGSPYRFRVDIELTDRGIDEATYDALVDLIREYKNKRSRLDALTVALTNRSQVPVIAAALIGGEFTTIYPLQLDGVEQASPVFIGAGLATIEITTIYPLEA